MLAGLPGGQCPRCLLALAAAPEETDALAPPACGQRFGKYELLEVVGHGGMGKVCRARETGLERIVALKFIHAGRFAGPEEVARFRQEAGAAARLDHPNIVTIHEVGRHEGQNYFAMQFIEGGTLAERAMGKGKRESRRTRRFPLPPRPCSFPKSPAPSITRINAA